jgi:hypothetical protein
MNDNWDELQTRPLVAGLSRARFLGRRITQNNTII